MLQFLNRKHLRSSKPVGDQVPAVRQLEALLPRVAPHEQVLWLAALLRRHWTMSTLLAFYVASTFAVPTLAPVPVSDDWIYARVVQTLLTQHVLRIPDISVTTLVFQAFWGGLFSSILGMTYGALRVSTIALVLAGSVALYLLQLEMGVNPKRSGGGVAAYLFNPLYYVLGFTFMTDPHFTSLLVITTYLYIRGIRRNAHSNRAIIAASLIASLAFLVRQQGALIPLGFATYLLSAGQLPFRWSSIKTLARVGAAPALTAVTYFAWLKYVNGIPQWQQGYLQYVSDAGLPATILLLFELAFIAVVYVGLFVLPLGLASFRSSVPGIRTWRKRDRLVFCMWALLVGFALFVVLPLGMTMPFVPHFLTTAGLGPSDLIKNRAPLFSHQALVAVTVLCGISSLIFISRLTSSRDFSAPSNRSAAGVLISIALWQLAGTVPASFAFRNWYVDGHIAPSLDRYFLPLLPLAICLFSWSTRDLTMQAPVVWLSIGVFAVYSIAGTRDSLALQQATWKLDQRANQLGVLNIQLDGGAAWDGEHLYDFSQQHHSQDQQRPSDPSRWWIDIWSPAIDSSYVVSTNPMAHFQVVQSITYTSWLRHDSHDLYLLQRLPTDFDR